VMRFFEGRSLKEVGAALGLTENAANMRVERSLEKLNRLLSRRGIHSTKATLAAVLVAAAVVSAPSTLAASAATGALAEKVGMTDQNLRIRTAQLRREQKASEARLKQEQNQQFEGVRTEQKAQKEQIEGVRTDVSTTRGDLEVTKAKLDKTIGDLGVQSGLIAHTREDLDQLKRRGDRNYYEFTLTKAKGSTPVSTVSLQLKKTDPKRGKFTLNVIADDRTIEKKDRTVYEPLQFYTGRDRMLYELVVFTVQKDKVTGYISTPKNAPTPAPTGN